MKKITKHFLGIKFSFFLAANHATVKIENILEEIFCTKNKRQQIVKNNI